jgi:hypothetical protein
MPGYERNDPDGGGGGGGNGGIGLPPSATRTGEISLDSSPEGGGGGGGNGGIGFPPSTKKTALEFTLAFVGVAELT